MTRLPAFRLVPVFGLTFLGSTLVDAMALDNARTVSLEQDQALDRQRVEIVRAPDPRQRLALGHTLVDVADLSRSAQKACLL